MLECTAMKSMLILAVLCGFGCSLTFAKDSIEVEVKAVHAVTHDDRGRGAIVEKGMMGSTAPTKQVESFNLDTIVNGEHVVLACDDPKGCESLAPGTYNGEVKRGKWIRLTFPLPVTHKEVTRWYKMAGAW